MLFTVIMNRKFIYSFIVLAIVLVATSLFFNSDAENEEFSEIVKISFRDIGNQLLLSSNDSTSLILPVVALEKEKYRLSFENEFSFEPDSLVTIVKESFRKFDLPKFYRIEVYQCTDEEVAYSYEVKDAEANSIIPCRGRYLPKKCYFIEVRFTDKTDVVANMKLRVFLLIFIVFGLIQFRFYKRKKLDKGKLSSEKYDRIGSFQFYPMQHKLVKSAIEIPLSKKECELLAIFISKPNQIIKREELMKKVWEDNGVVVGRSLDTYISKLRKKLKDDTSIKLTNVHGVGYKLEVD